MKKEVAAKPSSICYFVFQVYSWIMDTDKLGPKFIPMNFVINTQKSGTTFFVLALMLYFSNFSQAMWIYLGFHGTYGVAWQIKDSVFPDHNFQKNLSCHGMLLSYLLILGPYWIGSVLMASGNAWQEIPAERVALAMYFYVVGLILVFCADGQKYYTLLVKRGLIDNGFFKYSRNPNYFGQILIYFSFALLVNEPLFYGVNILIWSTLFMANMAGKEASFQKKQGWPEYQKRSWMLLFKINGSAVLSFFFYAILGAGLGFAIHKTGGFNIIPAQLVN